MNEQTGEQDVQPNKRLNAERLQKLESTGFAWSVKNVQNTKRETAAATVETEVASNSTHIHDHSLGNQTGSKPSSQGGASPTKNLPNHPTNNYVAAASANANRAVARHRPINGAVARHRPNLAQWQESHARLRSYRSQSGDCLVPRKSDQDPKTQRVLRNRKYRTIGVSGHLDSSGEPREDAIDNYNNDISATPPPPPQDEWQANRASVSLATTCAIAAAAAICGACIMFAAIIILVD